MRTQRVGRVYRKLRGRRPSDVNLQRTEHFAPGRSFSCAVRDVFGDGPDGVPPVCAARLKSVRGGSRICSKGARTSMAQNQGF